jgi:uncharacterized protein YjiS (DUF1127 family)
LGACSRNFDDHTNTIYFDGHSRQALNALAIAAEFLRSQRAGMHLAKKLKRHLDSALHREEICCDVTRGNNCRKLMQAPPLSLVRCATNKSRESERVQAVTKLSSPIHDVRRDLRASEGTKRPYISMPVREIGMTTLRLSPRENVLTAAQRISALRIRIVDVGRVWLSRIRSRRELAALSASELKDLGYPAAAADEQCKPFWRA